MNFPEVTSLLSIESSKPFSYTVLVSPIIVGVLSVWMSIVTFEEVLSPSASVTVKGTSNVAISKVGEISVIS